MSESLKEDSGQIKLNITLSNDDVRRTVKKTPKQRKVEYELKRFSKRKKSLQKNKKLSTKPQDQKKVAGKKQERGKQSEESGYVQSVLRGEVLPTVHSNEGNLYFPHLNLALPHEGGAHAPKRDDSKRKRKDDHAGKKADAGEKRVGAGSEKDSKKPKVSDGQKSHGTPTSGGKFASFVKKTKGGTEEHGTKTNGRVVGKFVRKSKKAALGGKSTVGGGKEAVGFVRKQKKHDSAKEKTVDFPEEEGVEEERGGRAGAALPGSAPKARARERGEELEPPAKRGRAAGGGGDAGGAAARALFGGNPALPAVPRRAVRPVHEPVFSDQTFSDLPIHRFSVSNLAALGLTRLTTVQRKAAPLLLAGRDALVRSQTGSGKTLAYALPLVERLQRARPPLTRAHGVRALVLLPTRELALQTYEWLVKLVKPFTRLVPGCLVGGEKRKSEKARLRKGITILVGTPGRVLDHVQHTRTLRLDRVQLLVLDEADRMLDMGYERDVASLVAELDSQSGPLLSKKVLEWNRKTSDLTKSSREDNVVGKSRKGDTTGHGSQDSDEEEEGGSDGGKPDEEDEASGESCSEGDEDSRVPGQENEESGKGGKASERKRKGEEEDAGEGARRQTVLLSATLTPAVQRLAGLALRSPVFVDAADADAGASDVVIPDSLTQSYLVAPAKLRLVTLAAFIVWKCKFTAQRKMLLFCATQDMVDYLTELLTVALSAADEQAGSDAEGAEGADELNVGVDFFRLHGNMDQKERTQVFQTFRAAECGVLLCTDVAARGLDLPRVDWIVQYTAPGSVADYVHRVGRAARAGAAGAALLFLLPAEADFVRLLQERRVRLQEEKMDTCLKKLALATGSSHARQKGPSSVEAAATALQLRFEQSVMERRSLHDFAVKAYVSFVRFYASYPREVRDVFAFKALHLGHHAKSFALRETPSAIAGLGRRRFLQQQQQPPSDGRGRWPKKHDGGRHRAAPKGAGAGSRQRALDLVLSEFASGLPAPKKKKKQQTEHG